MLYEWILVLGIIFGGQAHVEVVSYHHTKEDCVNQARQLIGDSKNFMRPALYNEITLLCHHTGEETKI